MTETPDAFVAIDSAVERLVNALERIATEHGPEAVDLAMTAYQVDAIQQVAGATIATMMIVPAVRYGRAFAAEFAKEENPVKCFTAGVAALVFGFFGLFGVIEIFVPVQWLAAFGSPEILVATNVLKSAGLM